jgi:serine/threonine protein kinase
MGDSSSGSAASGTPRSPAGTLLDATVAGHKLFRLLAAGGFGEVYLGKHQTLGVIRAVKVLHADMRGKDKNLERFIREAQVLARLQHNNIVQIIESGSLENGSPFLIMEYIEGPSLEHMIQHGPLQMPSVLIVLEQVALALQHAHAHSVIHRDMNPSNVLARSGDVRQVKVIDFGLARILDGEAERLTGDKQALGTVMYMAPEQADNAHDVTPATDVYALACTAYTIASGSPPFAYKKPMQVMVGHVSEVPPRLSSRCPEIPAIVDDLLHRCLAKDPAQRPRADEIVKVIGTHLRGSVPTPSTATNPRTVVPGARDIASQVFDQPIPRDPDGQGLALATKIMSLIEEIATYLSVSDPELTSLLRFEARICEQLASHEKELALVQAQLLGTPRDVELLKQCDAVHERIRTLHAQQQPLQRRMVEIVEKYRDYATGAMEALFRQMDRALAELQRLRRLYS